MILTNILETINRIDGDVLLFFNGMHSEFFDTVMYWISYKWTWVPFYILLAWLLVKKERWGAAIALLCIGLAVAVSDQVCANFIRHSVERLRPSNPDNPISEFVHIVNGKRGGRFGFPSSHAANTFALAVFISYVYRNRKVAIGMFSWAVIICYTRMYLGMHYPGDLIVGAIIGSLSGYGFYRLFAYLKTKPMPGFLPFSH